MAIKEVYQSLFQSYNEDVEKYTKNANTVWVIRSILQVGWYSAGKEISFENFGETSFSSREMSTAFQTIQTAMLLELVWRGRIAEHIVAQYYEYMPTERLDEDVRMMKECGINFVRIGESTWGYIEPQDGVFNTGMREWMELVTPVTAEVWASYDHPYWGQYAAITHNKYGKGTATYFAGYPTMEVMKQMLSKVVGIAGVASEESELSFPVIVRKGINEKGKTIRYYFNYSASPVTVKYSHKKAKELFSGKSAGTGDSFIINAWYLAIFEE